MPTASTSHLAGLCTTPSSTKIQSRLELAFGLRLETCDRALVFFDGVPGLFQGTPSESPLVLHRPDLSAQGLCGAVGPVGLSEQGPAQENQVGLLGLKNGLGL